MSDISDKLERQAELLFANVTGWEEKALRRIGERIKSMKHLSHADLQALNNATIVRQDIDAIIDELALLTEQTAEQVEEVYTNMLEEQHLENQPLYDYRDKPFVPMKDNKWMQAIVRAHARNTAETMVNLSMTKSKRIGSIDKTGKFVPLDVNYKKILDKAVMSITTGTGDFGSEMRDLLRELGGSGLRMDYGGGVTRRLDSMVRQGVLYGAKQASVEYNEMIGEELECDGIEIDWHTNPRPSHEFMQGKQFSLKGRRIIKGEVYESADKALKALNDYGCLHFPTPVILGVSVPVYDEKQLAELNKKNSREIEIDGVTKNGYGWKQTMRSLELQARYTKGEINILRASGDKEGVKQLKTKLNAINEKYYKISDATGIKAQPHRMSVVRGGKNTQNVLQNTDNGGIIKSGAVSGARNPYSEKAKEHANKYYGLVRSMQTDVKKISEGTGFTERQIQDVKNFIFYEKHDLGGDTLELFEPDYMMGESWRRLISGKPEPHDITLINHEIMERELIRQGYSQEEAHILTSKKYNYDKEATEFYDKIKKYSD